MKSMAICPMLTAFTDSGSLDFDANERQIERLIAGGIDGILFLGSIGEFSAISMEQKEEFSKFAIGRVNGRVRTIVGTSCASMEDTIRMNSVVCEAGADAAMILPPYYFAADEEALYRYYSTLAHKTSFPFMLYNYPATTGTNMSADLVCRLAREYPQIIGIKDTVENFGHTRTLIHSVHALRPDFEVFSGFDEYFLLNLMVGGNGVISGLNNIMPHVFRQLLDGYAHNNFFAMRSAQQKISSLMALYQVMPSFVQSIKIAISMLIDDYPTNMQLFCAAPTDAQTVQIRQILNEVLLQSSNHNQ